MVSICLFSVTAHSQSGGSGHDPFRQFTRNLPAVDRVEIIAVAPVVADEIKKLDCAQAGFICAPDTFPYKTGAVKTLTNEDARAFSARWRKLERDRLHYDDKCMAPDRLLRFYQNDKLLLESLFCTDCRKIMLPAIGVVSVAGSNDAPYYQFRDLVLPESIRRQTRENFKRQMMPKVGQLFTVHGLLLSGIKGMIVTYADGEIHLRDIDLKRTNELMNLGCHTAIKVTGTLRYYPEPPPQTALKHYASLPEHFYFEKPEIEVLRVEKVRRPGQLGRKRR